MTLIDKLSALTGPDREVDCRIWVAIGEIVFPFEAAAQVVPDFNQWRAPHYTASIDAAMTLVPEGFYPLLDWRGVHCRLRDDFGCDVEGAHALAATPAIALCIASLKARNL